MSAPDVRLDPRRDMTVEDVVAVARGGAGVTVDDWGPVERGRAWLERHVADWRAGRVESPIYGVTTGFGASKNVVLSAEEVAEAQLNLLRSHAIGVTAGPEDVLPDEVVRAVLLLRARTLLPGRSGVRRELIERLLGLLAADVLPRVPARGSVGASGDLCPLAHLALVLIGEGEASVGERGSRRVVPGAEALEMAGLEPLEPSFKEGLALINGTAVSSAFLALAVADAEVLVRTADVACASSLEAIGGHARALDRQVHAARRQVGQRDAAASLCALIAGSRRISSTDDKQDVYSFRCAPQVHGVSRDAIAWARCLVETELSAVTDNPLFFVLEGDDPPWDIAAFGENPRRFGRAGDDNLAYSAGNFHGQPAAVAADLLAIALSEIGSIAERRLAVLLDPSFSRGLPAHLSPTPGRRSGLMLAQYSAASLVSECKTLAHPASVDSIPTGSGAEDHVPMSTWAARKARTVASLVARVLALELLAAAQANDWRAVLPDPAAEPELLDETERRRAAEAFARLPADAPRAELGAGTAAAHEAVRSLSARVVDDRSLAADVEAIARAVLDGRFVSLAGDASRPVRRLRFVENEEDGEAGRIGARDSDA